MKLFMKYFLSKNTNSYTEYSNGNQNIVVALAADYGNLGDVAITYAQTNFLKKHFPEANIIDFPISKTFSHMKSLKNIIKSDDIITIVGGGNTGDMYDDIEYCRQFIIQQFPDNKIICFPQTIDFSDTPVGKKALKKAIKVYSAHKNLIISAREEKSFDSFKNLFTKNEVIFAPDIVLSLDKSQSDFEREGIIFCLREDGEKNISKDVQKELINKITDTYKVCFQDTHIDKTRMSTESREKELNLIWTVFKKSKLVITDRLHGMIFCAITNTPCIAIDNSNKKVSGVYNQWLRGYSTIKVLDSTNVEEIFKLIDNFLGKNSHKLQKVEANKFDDLIKSLKD